MNEKTPQAQLKAFIARFSPEIAAATHEVLAKMRAHAPGAIEFVYDNYYALVIGFGPNERPSDAIFSVVVYPRWVSICFLQDGPGLPDPHGLLRGGGTQVRHIRLTAPSDLDTPAVRALIAAALTRADPRIDPAGRKKLIIRAISRKQRPRRASASARGARRS
jgi:hypothetical protein